MYIYVLVANFMQLEKGCIYSLRLKILCQNEFEDLALTLSSIAMDIYNLEFKNRQYFEEQDYEFIRDIYYACLVRFNKNAELINHVTIIYKKYL